MRLRLDLAYDGTDFSGWAAQPGQRTVAGTLEAALATVTRLPAVRLTVAGRTDAGVHARGQVAHVDLPRLPGGPRRRWPAGSAAARRRRARPPARSAPAGFDARFSAVWRRYAYRICDDAASADPLVRRHVLSWPRRLDEIAMDEAAAALSGEHDFAAYCRKREGATTIRALLELAWIARRRRGEARCVADAFCHNMVRALVGCLLAVGEGRQPVDVAGRGPGAGARDPAVGGAGPRADARGGRLPAGRRAGRAAPTGDAGGAVRSS